MLATGNDRPAGQAGTDVVTALVARRKALRMRQRDVAELMGVSQGAVCQIEHGNPTMSTVTRYAHAVGLSVSFELQPEEPDSLTPERN